jgi:hypothetical protein
MHCYLSKLSFEGLEGALRDRAEFGDYGVERGRSKRGRRMTAARPKPSSAHPNPITDHILLNQILHRRDMASHPQDLETSAIL